MRAQETKPLALLRTIGCALHTAKRVGVLFPTAVPPERSRGERVFSQEA